MPIYEGNEPYLFISYSHKDNDVISEITGMLDEYGCRYWYDKGIHSGNDWNEVIAGKLKDSTACILLLSPAAASSKYVKNELTFVENMGIPLYPVLIKDYVGVSIRDLPADIAMTLGRIQMIPMSGNFCERLLSGLPDDVFAPDGEDDFEITAGVLEQYDGDGGDVTVPEGVTSIGKYAFSVCKSLTSITIPDSVTSIGYGAFWDCSSLTSITIPNSVTSIEKSAFEGCKNLASITLPDSLTEIGSSAFSGCSKLANVYIEDLASWCNIQFSYTDSNPLCYGGRLYLNGEPITDLVIPDGVTGIGNYAFVHCGGIASITVPNSVTVIGASAFADCKSLVGVTIPDSVKTIGGGAFDGCSSLTNITVGNGVTSIDKGSFYGTAYENNTDNWDNGMLYIGNCLIGAKYTVSDAYSIKEGTKCIANYAFRGCSWLTSITLPDSMKIIGEGAFSCCSNLTNIIIGNGVTSIGDEAFEDCGSLTSITFKGTKAEWNAIGNDKDWNNYKTGRYTVYCTDGYVINELKRLQ